MTLPPSRRSSPPRRRNASVPAAVERVESRVLFHLEVTAPLPDITVTPGASQTIDLGGSIDNEEINGTVVRLTTNVGALDLELFDADAPLSVANFLNYVNGDLYNGTIFHRAVEDFVVQGGGYTATGPGNSVRVWMREKVSVVSLVAAVIATSPAC